MVNKKIVQVLGPTGIGKSEVAVDICKKFGGEIISADSVQVYRGFDIGTAKLGLSERENVPHYLIDLLDDCSQFNAHIFLHKAFDISENILKRGKVPVVCGGTALYLRVMISGIFPETAIRKVNRDKLEKIVREKGLAYLWEKLNEVDPEYAQKISPNDRIRIIRAMDIYYNNDLPPSEIFKFSETPFKDYDFLRIGLTMERKRLYERINQRVDRMIHDGFVTEVKDLVEKYPLHCPPFKSLGYAEIIMYLKGQIELPEAIGLIKQHSRNFAKRQLSWFRKERDVAWFEAGQNEEIMTWLQDRL